MQATAAPAERSGYLAARELLRRDVAFSAVFCSSDLGALGAVNALREGGLTVPGDVSVVGFDDIPAASYATPALTTVRQDTARAGKIMVDALLQLVAGEAIHSQLIEPELMIRASCRAH